jgi:hypothetical protein
MPHVPAVIEYPGKQLVHAPVASFVLHNGLTGMHVPLLPI